MVFYWGLCSLIINNGVIYHLKNKIVQLMVVLSGLALGAKAGTKVLDGRVGSCMLIKAGIEFLLLYSLKVEVAG